MATDPRAANCRAERLDAQGRVIGVELKIETYPDTEYELVKAELIDEPTNGVSGPHVANFVVQDEDGGDLFSERVWLAWPYPALEGRGLPGNPNRQHEIVNPYYPTSAKPEDPKRGLLAMYVGDENGNPRSDIVGQIGLRDGHHVSFAFQWRRRAKPDPEPDPDVEYGDFNESLRSIAESSARTAAALEQLAADFAALRKHFGA